MTVALIIMGYLIIIPIEVLMLRSKNKDERAIKYYTVFMIISGAISIFIAVNEGIPSIASIIIKLFSPIIKA